MNVRDTPILQQMMKSGKGIAIPDTAAEKRWSHTLQLEALGSYAGAPIRQNDETIGFLHLGSRTPDFYRPEHARRLDAFANHAAIALRNAQLYSQAQELAAFRERQRLARELHDAVLQSLWSTTIMADVLPQIWQRDPLKGAERLQRLKQLTRGAMAEMRALLIELRPAALAEIKLEELLQQLLEATGSRTNANIHFNVKGTDELPPHVRHAFYRIAQEALHNIVRHSNASQIQLELCHEQFVVELIIVDNGEGFILEQVPPGHMGLSIMRERAEEIKADFEVSTRLHEGTTVRVTWSRQESFEG